MKKRIVIRDNINHAFYLYRNLILMLNGLKLNLSCLCDILFDN